MNDITDELFVKHNLPDAELKTLIDCRTDSPEEDYLFARAVERRKEIYSNDIFIRGLIEFSNYCKNNCLYCGIRAANTKAERYRLTKEEILECTDYGYSLGFRTFVLQSGEDPFFNDKDICEIISSIKSMHDDCAVTLSIGEKPKKVYEDFFKAGADRYLLRHETANTRHYERLHPKSMSLSVRKQCLFDLKEIGFQVGSGFMVGSPYQTLDNLVEDIRFLQELDADMIGIGPFLPHKDTPFASQNKGSMSRCLHIIAILRLMFPYSLIPSTTALGTINPHGRELGLRVGANVVMPNLSPKKVREKYLLYNDKAYTGLESAEGLRLLQAEVEKDGYRIVIDRGDAKRKQR